jgi:hypothetical protein
MNLRDLALTVLELDEAQFHWVLLEAVEADVDDSLVYRPVDSSTIPFDDYAGALVHGTVALRSIQGLPPLGQQASADRQGPAADQTVGYPSDLASMI